MRKLQDTDAEVMRIAIQQEIGHSEESRYDHRLHDLLLVTAGHSCRQLLELFEEDGTTVAALGGALRKTDSKRCASGSGPTRHIQQLFASHSNGALMTDSLLSQCAGPGQSP